MKIMLPSLRNFKARLIMLIFQLYPFTEYLPNVLKDHLIENMSRSISAFSTQLRLNLAQNETTLS